MNYNSREWNKAEAYHSEHFLRIGDKVTFGENAYFETTNYNLSLEDLKHHLNNLYDYEIESDGLTFTILGYKTHNKSGTFAQIKEQLLEAIDNSTFSNRYELITDFKMLVDFARNPYAGEGLWDVQEKMKKENTFSAGKLLMREHVEIMY